MHSAMDTRSNANLVTVTNDALKDPEPEESDVSDMWILEVHNDGHFITMAIWHDPAPQALTPTGVSMGWANSNIFTHVPVPLLHQCAAT